MVEKSNTPLTPQTFKRYLAERLRADLDKKLVILTGPRQVGKTTLSRQLQADFAGAQYFNYDVPAQRAVLSSQGWSDQAPLLIFDEIHKMAGWKSWLKGAFDGRASLADGAAQRLLVTGSARMDTFSQAGESLAGRYYALRLHPISVFEWCDQTGASPQAALAHLLKRGGFPEPCLAAQDTAGDLEAERWRTDYFSGMIREDVLEFSRIFEINTMRVFAESLRSRVGSPLSLASIGRDMCVSPATLKKYLDILEALYIVFTVRPWSKNITRATLQQPKVYFFDTGLVRGDDGVRFENLVAAHLIKQAHWKQDTEGRNVQLHYLRTTDNAEVDFAMSSDSPTRGELELTHIIECKWSDGKPHRTLQRFAEQFPEVTSVQVVRDLKVAQQAGRTQVVHAAQWLYGLGV